MASHGSERVKHLWQLAVQCAKENPALSRFYLSEISSSADEDLLGFFALQYCHHCFELFTTQTCRVRVLPKRTKHKKQKRRMSDHNEKRKVKSLKLPRKLNHVCVLCKTCGKQSFYAGQPRSIAESVSKTLGTSSQSNDISVLSTPRISSMDYDSTPNLPKSGKRRQRRHKFNLKGLLLADEKEKSVSTRAGPRLQDFLSSL